MRWDGLPAQATPHSGHSGGISDRSAAALARLRSVEQAIGASLFRQAEALLADRASRRSFAALCGSSVKQADAAGLSCLRRLAGAYALNVRTPG